MSTQVLFETVPEAITAFLEGQDFEDVIRTAVSLGGNCDTLTCIAGGMAETEYHTPEGHKEECIRRLPEDLRETMKEFYEVRGLLKVFGWPDRYTLKSYFAVVREL